MKRNEERTTEIRMMMMCVLPMLILYYEELFCSLYNIEHDEFKCERGTSCQIHVHRFDSNSYI